MHGVPFRHHNGGFGVVDLHHGLLSLRTWILWTVCYEPRDEQCKRLCSLPSWLLLLCFRRHFVHSLSRRHHHGGFGAGQYLSLGLHSVRAWVVWHRVESGHDERSRLYFYMPCRSDNIRSNGEWSHSCGLHKVCSRLLRHCDKPGHNERSWLHRLPSWRHDGGRRRRQRFRCGLHYVRARLLWRRYEPGHNKRRRLLGMPRRHLLRGRRRLHLHVLSRGRHDRGRSDGQHLSFVLFSVRAWVFRLLNEPGHYELHGLYGRPVWVSNVLVGYRRLCFLDLHHLSNRCCNCWHLHNVSPNLLCCILPTDQSLFGIRLWMQKVSFRHLFECWQHFRRGLHVLHGGLLWLCYEPRYGNRSRLRGMSGRHYDAPDGKHLRLGLHPLHAWVLRHRDEPRHDECGRLHSLPNRHLLVSCRRISMHFLPGWVLNDNYRKYNRCCLLPPPVHSRYVRRQLCSLSSRDLLFERGWSGLQRLPCWYHYCW